MDRLGYRPALDGLRCCAVLAVLMLHSWHGLLPGGWVGVDLFFVLSGFLITTILLTEHLTTGAISLYRFYARRVLRLLPAVAVLIPFCICAALFLQPSLLPGTLHEALASSAYVSNWLNPSDPHGLLAHMWSLAVEEQFYLIWPVLLCAGLRLVGPRWTLRIVLIGIAVLVTGRAASWTTLGPAVYFRTDTRADALLVGVALSLAYALDMRPSRRVALLWGGVGATVLLGMALRYDINVLGERELALGGFTVVALAAGGVLVAALELSLPPLSWRPVVGVGRISYGLYLWHYPIATLVHARLAGDASPFAVIVVLSFIAAMLSHRYVERPFLRLKRRVAASAPVSPGRSRDASPRPNPRAQ
jgi:peptidoglycan/LPS O-acetylase OafA/YrhL